jgi:hypothetical protein
MKKNTIIYLVLILCSTASYFLKFWIKNFHFFLGACFGAAVILLVVNYFGQRQLNKAVKRVDKVMKDRIVAIEEEKTQYDDTDD